MIVKFSYGIFQFEMLWFMLANYLSFSCANHFTILPKNKEILSFYLHVTSTF